MDLKQTITDDELEEIRKELGISEDDSKKWDCTPQSAVEEGDEFTLVGVRKVREKAENGFLPLVFTTSNGKSIGTKHFGSIEFPKDTKGIQPIGRTIDDAVRYMLWAKKNSLTYTVDNIKKLPARKIKQADGTETEYRPKQIELSVRLKEENKKGE